MALMPVFTGKGGCFPHLGPCPLGHSQAIAPGLQPFRLVADVAWRPYGVQAWGGTRGSECRAGQHPTWSLQDSGCLACTCLCAPGRRRGLFPFPGAAGKGDWLCGPGNAPSLGTGQMEGTVPGSELLASAFGLLLPLLALAPVLWPLLAGIVGVAQGREG